MDFTLLELLEEELIDAKGYLKRKIDVGRCVQLLDALKESLPQYVVEAQKIVECKQSILQNADAIAQKTILTAEQKATKILSESELTKRAELEAKKIINKASIQRDVLIDKTKTHLQNVFDQTEQMLQGLIAMIHKNRQELKSIDFNK